MKSDLIRRHVEVRRHVEGEDIGPVIERMAASYARRSPCEKDDLMQEAWLELLRRPNNPQVLVVRTAITNAIAREIAWKRRQKKFAKPEAVDRRGAVDAKIDAETMLGLMDDLTRGVCLKHHIGGVSLPDIAKEDQIPFKTIESRLYKGMLRFRKKLCGGKSA